MTENQDKTLTAQHNELVQVGEGTMLPLGRLTIPKHFREAHGLKDGDKVTFWARPGSDVLHVRRKGNGDS